MATALASFSLTTPSLPSCHFRSSKSNCIPLPRCLLATSAMSSSKQKPEKISFGDRLLDYIEGGPKLRKWYGASDQLPRDGDETVLRGDDVEEQLQEENENRDAILITDGDSMIGQLVLLALILKRVRIRTLVKDAKEIVAAFGSYVEPVVGDVADKQMLRRALKGARAVVCPSKVGALADKEILKGIEHIVFLSQLAVYSDAGGLAALINANARRQAEEDEEAMRNLGIPCTIVRSAALQDEPGGKKGLVFKKGSAGKGKISREDAAMICVKALEFPPSQALVFEVANGDNQVDDWNALFESLNCSPA